MYYILKYQLIIQLHGLKQLTPLSSREVKLH
jgi:hypothetical protein